MLDEIHASNVGLIDNAAVAPSPGLTVLTGETGAGKTLMLGALRLVRGDTASREIVGPHAEVAEVTARFLDTSGDEVVVRRTVANGRSRAYLNGRPVTAGELSATVGELISIVSQGDQHMLTTSDGVRRVVDSALSKKERTILGGYHAAYGEREAVRAEMGALGSDHRSLERELDMLRFQIAEIREAGFQSGDEEALRLQLDRMRHGAEISAEAAVALSALGDSGAEAGVEQALAAIKRVERLDPGVGDISGSLAEIASRLRETVSDLTQYAETLHMDPAGLALAESRLAELSALERKYGATVADIDVFAKEAHQRSEHIARLLDAASDIQERHEQAADALERVATQLRLVRAAHASRIASGAQEHLKDLGFNDPVVSIVVEPKEPTASGADRFRILFASDSSLTPAEISAVASGGELSRLVLALTLASGGAEASVVAFDEIDAGIGGATALAMGQKLARLATTRQVICVTHLPQVAAFGTKHYTVTRVGTRASVHPATGPERVDEIARMLAGLVGSDKAKQHAAELLAIAEIALSSE